MKKLLSVLLTSALLMSLLAGCGGSAGKNTDASGDAGDSGKPSILYHAAQWEPYTTLDPSAENSTGILVLNNTYETLTRYNYETGETEPLLATEWSSNDEGTEWVFQIREGVKFHDGAELNADAVVASIQRTMELGQGSAFIWDPVESVEATGEYEVTFHLTYGAAMDLIASSGYAAYIMSPNAVDKDAEWFNQGNNAGTGPYMIMKLTEGEEVILNRFEDYWGGWSDNQYSNVMIKKVAESSARRQMLETGEAQIACAFSSTDLAALKKESDLVQVLEAPTFTNVTLALNTEAAPMNNADFRRAMAYAFPYDDTVNSVLEGTGTQSVGMVPAGLWGHDDSLFQYTTDLDKAQEYIDKSGVDTTNMTLTVSIISGDDAYRNLCQLYQVNLKKLGINLEIRELSWDSQWDLAKSTNPEDRQDMMCWKWYPDYASPNSWFYNLVQSEETINMNMAYIHDEALDAKIAEADALAIHDRDAASAIYAEMQKQLIDECQYIYLYDEVHNWVVANGVEGVDENPAYAQCLRYYDITHS